MKLSRNVTRTGVVAAAGLALAALLRRRSHVMAAAPELRTPMTWVPLVVGNRVTLMLGRAMFAHPTPVLRGVSAQRHLLADRAGHDVPVHVYRPADDGVAAALPALLWIHGGGLILGAPETDHEFCSRLVNELGIVVVSVDYRLAPEHPFPAGLNDTYTALRWVHGNAESLRVNPSRIAVGGASAGGGLAACLAQLALDRDEVPVVFQLLLYPMLDDRTVLRSDHAGTGRLAWTPRSNRYAWTSYLGHRPRQSEDRPYAAAARRADLTGLPAAWIGVGSLDLFLEEDVVYAERLQAAGTDCQLHLEPRMQHAADVALAESVPSMRAFRRAMTDALAAGLGVTTSGAIEASPR